MRLSQMIVTAAVLSLSIISTTFVLLTLTSPKWSSQSYFYAEEGATDGTGQTQALCKAARSPFYRCGVPAVNPEKNCTIPDCKFYKPYGNDRTSCRSPTEMGISLHDPSGARGLFGSSQECQQVHYAGNLQIAASLFITLGLILSLALALFPFLNRSPSSPTEPKDPAPEPSTPRSKGGIKLYTVFFFLFCLYAGALLQLLAQFFGVLGLTMNATPTAADVTGNQPNGTLSNFAAQAWVIDRALSAYATVAWTAALMCAAVTTAAFRTPRLIKLL